MLPAFFRAAPTASKNSGTDGFPKSEDANLRTATDFALNGENAG